MLDDQLDSRNVDIDDAYVSRVTDVPQTGDANRVLPGKQTIEPVFPLAVAFDLTIDAHEGHLSVLSSEHESNVDIGDRCAATVDHTAQDAVRASDGDDNLSRANRS